MVKNPVIVLYTVGMNTTSKTPGPVPGSMSFVKGLITKAKVHGSHNIFVLPCNTLGIMPFHYFTEVTEAFPGVLAKYMELIHDGHPMGSVSPISKGKSENDKAVIELTTILVMDGLTRDIFNNPLIHSESFREAAESLKEMCASFQYTVHIPLLRGVMDWETIKAILLEVFVDQGTSVVMYEDPAYEQK